MRLNITLPDKLANDLDLKVKQLKHTRSGYIAELIRNSIYDNQPIKKVPQATTLKKKKPKMVSYTCDFCKFPPTGKFKIERHDWEQGETTETVQLCQSHYEKAKKEGKVTKI